jgi:hypothetical protein
LFSISRRQLALLGATAAVFPRDALAQGVTWRRAMSASFVVYSSAAASRLRDVVRDLESLDALLRRFTAAPATRSPTRLEVFLFSGHGPFQEAFPGMRQNVDGLYSANTDIIAAYAIFNELEGFSAQEVLFHEYAHHFFFQYFANAYPAWYVEGFAEFISTTTFNDDRTIIGRSSDARASTLNDRRETWMPMEQLLTVSPWQLDAQDAGKFYAQSWLFTHYLVMTPGKLDQFRAYVEALRHGAEPLAAFQTGFGMTPTDMQRTLRIYLADRPHGLALTRPAEVAHEIADVDTLPPSAGVLLPISTRVRRGVAQADAPALLARVRQLVGATPGDRFALMTLARAEATMGDSDRARALLGPYVQSNSTDIEALYLMGLSYVTDAEKVQGDARHAPMTQARHYLVQANRLDDNNVAVLYRYAETFAESRLDETTFNNTINVLLLAHQLAPQISEIGFYAASALMSADRNAEAALILRPIAYDPHGGEAAHQALTMLQQAEHGAAGQAHDSTPPAQSDQAAPH